jgi:hypothetical protein
MTLITKIVNVLFTVNIMHKANITLTDEIYDRLNAMRIQLVAERNDYNITFNEVVKTLLDKEAGK